MCGIRHGTWVGSMTGDLPGTLLLDPPVMENPYPLLGSRTSLRL